MSALPKAVQAQLDAAEALQAQLANPTPEQGTPEAEPSPQQEAVQQPETVQQQTQVTNTVPDDVWEQRFKVLEGKFKAEVPRLHETNRELQDKLEQALKALEQASQQQAKPEDPKLVTDADVDAFGGDLVDMVRRASREEFDKLSKILMDVIEKRFGQVTQKVAETEKVVAKTASEKFWDKVYGAHGDFDKVNDDPRWFAFLDAKIPGARFTRRALAEDAIAKLDADALVETLTDYKASLPQEPVAKPKQKKLDSQVAPNSSSASAPSAGTESGRIWTWSEYEAAIDPRNIHKMSATDFEKLVEEANQAYFDGRVK